MFITIEGPDHAGKTTQLNLLKQYSENNSNNWIFTRNPGGTNIGKELRNILLNTKEPINNTAEMFIYLADRAQHVGELLKPNLKKGSTIICDRFTDSTIAYQGYGRGSDINMLKRLNEYVCQGLKPDLTILLLIDYDIAISRRTTPPDRLEKESKLFHLRVSNGFKALASESPERIKTINVNNLDENEVHQKIIEIINKNT